MVLLTELVGVRACVKVRYIIGHGVGGGGLTRSRALGLADAEWSGGCSSLAGIGTLSGMVAIPFSRCALAACADVDAGVDAGVACPGIVARPAKKLAAT